MFVTDPSFKQFMPVELAPPNVQHWRAAFLSTSLPWFVFVYQHRERKVMRLSTLLLAWESTLMGVLREIPGRDHIALSLMHKKSGASEPWIARELDEVWASAPAEAVATGGMVFRYRGEGKTYGAHLVEAARDMQGRELLFQRNGGARR